MERAEVLWLGCEEEIAGKEIRCAIYTRKSTEEGLDQDFNSLHAQREACEAYIKSQIGFGWKALTTEYDDGGFSGGSMERPALQRLLADIKARRVDVVVVYEVDRLTRALTDFAKIVDVFDSNNVSFVSITQAFNTTISMGRLTFNVLLSFEAVTRRHSYVIGGNSEKEHFGPPDRIAAELTDRTCESCNTYNMLRLTRHLWSWRQDGAYFDYFERAHLNHIMAQQHPETGRKVYFMPLGIGTRRLYSRPEHSFWCCVGTGMESHAKHGESIFWRRDDTLFVNLFVPSSLNWEERGARFDLDTNYPNSERVDISVADAGRENRFAIALRLPAWCVSPSLALNGRNMRFERRDGYAIVRRGWRAGDRLALTLPMQAQASTAPDDPRTFAFVSGPLVLAADLGEGNQPMAAPVPGLPTAPPGLQRIDQHVYRLETHGGAVTLRPYFSQHDRWTAPYLQQIEPAVWATREAAFRQAQARTAALDARTIDTIKLGEEASERAHGFRERNSDLFSAQGVYARQVGWGDGDYIAFDLAVQDAPMNLHVLYWGEDVDKHFDVSVAGTVIAHERLDMAPTREFVAREYEIPTRLTRGKTAVPVQFTTYGSNALVYVARTTRRI